jgi:hypothetical protein
MADAAAEAATPPAGAAAAVTMISVVETGAARRLLTGSDGVVEHGCEIRFSDGNVDGDA